VNKLFCLWVVGGRGGGLLCLVVFYFVCFGYCRGGGGSLKLWVFCGSSGFLLFF
jgi:hypothetical protein